MTTTTPANLFTGQEATAACRVCGGPFGDQSVWSGREPYATQWRKCAACGSWSVGFVPPPGALDRFYSDYEENTRKSAVNADNNDGRRWTPAWRETREREYRLGIADAGLEIRPGARVLDYGALDGVFLDVCRAIEPTVSTTGVDYAETAVALEALGHRYEPISRWGEGTAQFDIVTLWDVYEHVEHLDAMLTGLSRRLAAGGEVLLQTPRAGLHADLLGPLWHHFLPVQHLQLPSLNGIVGQFERHGFTLRASRSFGSNAPPSIVPQPYKLLFDTMAKQADLGSTQVLRFARSER